MYVRFEDFRAFLCVFMIVFRVFVHLELWIKVSVSIFFPVRWIESLRGFFAT